MRSPTTIAPRPNGLPRLARSQELKSKRRLATTAVGAIGRPERRASMTMPSPATRARLATSAVIATEAPPSSWRSNSRIAGAPPLRRLRSARPPEPRTGVTPSRRSAAAWGPPSPLREMRAAIRGIDLGHANEIIRCCPCHIATITGV